MKEKYDEYWFPAKRYGWGWGPPNTWQGWVVLVGYITAVLLISNFVPPRRHPVVYFVSMLVSTAALITICWFKGEPPHWRWGGKDLK